jgi:hypothetical protein
MTCDFKGIEDKLRIGQRVYVDCGMVRLTVIGFEGEKKFL